MLVYIQSIPTIFSWPLLTKRKPTQSQKVCLNHHLTPRRFIHDLFVLFSSDSDTKWSHTIKYRVSWEEEYQLYTWDKCHESTTNGRGIKLVGHEWLYLQWSCTSFVTFFCQGIWLFNVDLGRFVIFTFQKTVHSARSHCWVKWRLCTTGKSIDHQISNHIFMFQHVLYCGLSQQPRSLTAREDEAAFDWKYLSGPKVSWLLCFCTFFNSFNTPVVIRRWISGVQFPFLTHCHLCFFKTTV